MKRKHSGFDCPIYGVVVPKGWQTVRDADGICYLVPPNGAEVPDDLRPYVKNGNKYSKN